VGPHRPVIALLLTIGLSLSCVSSNRTWIEPRVARLELEGWFELTSPDFILYSNGTKEDLEALAVDLARYIAVVERLVEAESPKTPAHLVVVDERAEELFIPYRWYEAYMGHTLAGFNGFVRGGRYDPTVRSVLLHEYTHYLTGRNTRLNYPIWYEEGFAEFLGPIRARGDTMEVGSRPPWRLEQLKARQARKEPIDLSKIFSFERSLGAYWPSEFYAISWATVHYLNSDPERRKRLTSMVKKQASGLGWKKAYSTTFSESLEDLAKKIEHHAAILNRGTPAAILYLPFEALEIRTKWKLRALTPQETIRLFAEFAVQGVVAASDEYKLMLAVGLFERALELTPNDSRTHAGLASALSQQGKFERAETHLMEFETDPDPSVTALVLAGHALAQHARSLEGDELVNEREEKHENAIHLYRGALEVEPENAFALAGLGHSLLAIKEFEQARESLAKAQSFGEWDAALTLDRARVEQEMGFSDRARVFWKEVVRLGSEEQAKEAAALLVLEDVNAAR
jgi:tetratricopeptide (TPR) repeat protein